MQDDEFVNRLILKFCSPGTRIARMGRCLHVLDVFKKSLLYHVEKPNNFPHELDEGSEKIIRSAAELNYAGIRFKKSETNSLSDISFARGVLRLPVIQVDDTTESVFLNLIAFERLHIGAGYEVSSLVSFMEDIIANERDVELLHTQGIIHNAIGRQGGRRAVPLAVQGFGAGPRNNPWAILSLIAAILALALTIIQTAYTVLSYNPSPQFASLK
ncbi:hypothetical protein NL676_005597 [Syzygium grande]|nr:hypothetical protein NL676_005597 [Syzygium grande]